MNNFIVRFVDLRANAFVIEDTVALLRILAVDNEDEDIRERADRTISQIELAVRQCGAQGGLLLMSMPVDKRPQQHQTTRAAKLRERWRHEDFERQFEAMQREIEMERHGEPA